MDITGLDEQPRQNAEWQNAIFFIVFVCVSAHFMIKSFVAAFCDQAGLLFSASILCAVIELSCSFAFVGHFPVSSKKLLLLCVLARLQCQGSHTVCLCFP